MYRFIARLSRGPAFSGSATYWESRYSLGGTSGLGSVGRLAEFKAAVLNRFVAENGTQSVLEFGCGDGQQLALAEYPTYVGLDVSPTAIRMCQDRFAADPSKSFYLYDPTAFVDRQRLFRADLVLSLDVIYHLVEDDIFDAYMRHVFAAADSHVVIYSTDRDTPSRRPHVRERRFTPWISHACPEWRLLAQIPNPYPPAPQHSGSTSAAEFFIYGRAPA
jgi:SAM-dependent methyltransferase